MAENYIEKIIIRQDSRPDVQTPTFNDIDIDEIYEFEGLLILKQIIKSVRNKEHNSHDYVFVVDSISKLKQED